jgi:small-conductance mechanosensitive channel
MRDCRGDHFWKGIASLLVVLAGTTSSFAASGGDPNAASEPAFDLSNLNMSTLQEILTFDLTEKIKVALEENGLSIPFPQRDVHIRQGSFASGGN